MRTWRIGAPPRGLVRLCRWRGGLAWPNEPSASQLRDSAGLFALAGGSPDFTHEPVTIGILLIYEQYIYFPSIVKPQFPRACYSASG